jgi:hypothetical protein
VRARYGERQPAAGLSWGHAIRNRLQEDAARAHRYAIVVSSIDFAMLPAAVATVEVLEEAVSRATPRVRLNGFAGTLLEQPDRLQVTLPAIGWLHVTTGDEPLRSLHRSKAERPPSGA